MCMLRCDDAAAGAVQLLCWQSGKNGQQALKQDSQDSSGRGCARKAGYECPMLLRWR